MVPINLGNTDQDSPAYRSLHAQGLVPTLMTDEGALSQSLSIIEYLESMYPEPPLLPRVPIARAKVQAMAALIACDLHPLNSLRVLNYLRKSLGIDATEIAAWYRHWVAEGLGALEQLVVAHGGQYCFGDEVTLADVCLVPQMYNARRFAADLTPYPTLRSIDSHLQSLAAFADSAPEKQVDAV